MGNNSDHQDARLWAIEGLVKNAWQQSGPDAELGN